MKMTCSTEQRGLHKPRPRQQQQSMLLQSLVQTKEGSFWASQSTHIQMTRGTMIYFDGIVDVEVDGICFA